MTVADATHDEVNDGLGRTVAARLRFDVAILNIRQTVPAAARSL